MLDGTSSCRGHWRSAVGNGIVALQGRVRTYLQQELGIQADKLEMRQFGHGQSNPTYYLKVLPPARCSGRKLLHPLSLLAVGHLLAAVPTQLTVCVTTPAAWRDNHAGSCCIPTSVHEPSQPAHTKAHASQTPPLHSRGVPVAWNPTCYQMCSTSDLSRHSTMHEPCQCFKQARGPFGYKL